MKNKNLLVIALVLVASTAFGQTVKPDNTKFQEKKATFFPEIDQSKGALNKRDVSGWFNYDNDLRENGENFAYLGDVILWPDSMPVYTYGPSSVNDPNHIFSHSVGQVYDPSSFYYVDPESFDSRFVSYTIDSIAFFFKYHNFGDSTDKLRIQFYDPSGIIPLFWVAPLTGETRSVRYSKSDGKGQDAADETVIDLDSTVNTENFWQNESNTYNGVIQIPVGLTISPSAPYSDPENLFALSVMFEPGNPNYQNNDTMNRWDSTITDGNQMSIFQPYYLRGDGAASGADDSYNHGLLLFNNGVYGSSNNFWNPMNAPGQPMSHLRSFIHVTTTAAGLESLDNGYGLGKAYPNPATTGELTVPFALGQGEEVSITVTDMSGRVVSTFESTYFSAGENQVKIDISGVEKGMYIYELKAGNYVSSDKVIVQ